MKRRAYIDIETTGLSRSSCDITVIGIGHERRSGVHVVQLVNNDLCEKKLLAALEGADEIYSYNGSRFDLPFISANLGVDLARCFKHTDLMYDCWRQGLKGGLKVVERKLSIARQTEGIDGYMAVQLWWKYQNDGDKLALRTLLDYNREDVSNLRLLRRKLRVL